jgi:hypothetical protein
MDLLSMFLVLATRDRSGRAFGYQTYGFAAALLREMLLEGNLPVHATPRSCRHVG